MRKIISFFVMCFVVLAPGGVMAAACSGGSTVINTSHAANAWAVVSPYSIFELANNPTAVAQKCQNTYGYSCSAPGSSIDSTVTAASCALFLAAGMSTLTDIANLVCCTTEASVQLAQSLGSGGGNTGGDTGDDDTGDDDGGGTTTTPKNIVLMCPSGLTATQCRNMAAVVFLNVFGTTSVGQANCADLGVAESGYCFYDINAGAVINTYKCPENQISGMTRTLGGRAYTSSSAQTGQYNSATFSYFVLTPVAQTPCICSPEYYGGAAFVTLASAERCQLCPCQTAKNGTVCGVTYDVNSFFNSMQSLIYGMLQNSGYLSMPKTSCKITCTSSDGCYDDAGTFVHTSACAWAE